MAELELAPATELEAVNVLLSVIGESPVNVLDYANNLYSSLARQTLYSVSREVQSRGWYFNQSESITLPIDDDGHVQPTAVILKLYPARGGTPLTIRNGRVWNPLTNSDTFAAAPTADFVVWFLIFEELPESAKRYITIRAARIFQTSVLGSDQLNAFSQQHEREAYQIFIQEAADFEYGRGWNILSGSTDTSDILGDDNAVTVGSSTSTDITT